MTKRKAEMPIWQRRPDDDEMSLRYELYRVPARGAKGLIILSHDVLGAYTHWWRGRTNPCTGENCSACAEGNRRRWHGWFMTLAPQQRRQLIFEVTAAGAAAVDAYFKEHRTLRGAVITALRVPAKENGKLILSLAKSSLQSQEIPKAAKIEDLLLKIWDMEPKSKDAKTVLEEMAAEAGHKGEDSNGEAL